MHPLFHWLPMDFAKRSHFICTLPFKNILSSAVLFPGERRHFHLYSSLPELGALSTLAYLRGHKQDRRYCPKCCLHTL